MGAPLWATLHAVLLGISVLLLSYPIVTALVGADLWWTQTSGFVTGTCNNYFEFVFDAALPALMIALSRWVLHFGYRRSIYRRGYDNTEHCLVAVGLNWLLLAQIGAEPFIEIPERFDARSAPHGAGRQAANAARHAVWAGVLVISGSCVTLGVVLRAVRLRWLRAVRQGHVEGWRVALTENVTAISFCSAPWSAGGAVLQKQHDGVWQSVGSVSARGTQHRLSGQEAPEPPRREG